MFCVQCGATLREGAMFCGQCGAKQPEVSMEPVTEVLEQEVNAIPESVETEVVEQDEIPLAEETVVSEEPVEADALEESVEPKEEELIMQESFVLDEMPAQKKKSSKGKVIAIIVVVLAILGALSFVFRKQLEPAFESIKNAVVSVLPAEKQLQVAYENSAKKWANETGELIGTLKSTKTGTTKMTVDGQLMVQVDETILQQVLPVDLGGVNKVSMDYVYAIDEERFGMQLALALSDQKIVSMNYILDMAREVMTMQIPEASEQAWEVPLSEMGMDKASYNEAMQELQESMAIFQGMLPSEAYTKEFLPKYLGIIFGTIEEAKKEKVTLQVGDVSQKVTAITVDVDKQIIDKIGDAVVEALKEDREFKNYLKDFYNAVKTYGEEQYGENVEMPSFSDTYDELLDGVKDTFDELKKSEYVEDGFEYITWINSDNEVIGIQIGEELRIASVQNQEKVAWEFCAMEASDEMAKVIVEGTKIDNVFEGSVEIYSKEEKVFAIDVEKYISTQDEFACVVSLDIPDELVSEIVGMSIPGKVKLKVDLSSKNNSVAFKGALSWSGKDIVKLELTGNVKTGVADIEYPSNVTDNQTIWMMGINPNTILENLKKAGLSEEIINNLFKSVY